MHAHTTLHTVPSSTICAPLSHLFFSISQSCLKHLVGGRWTSYVLSLLFCPLHSASWVEVVFFCFKAADGLLLCSSGYTLIFFFFSSFLVFLDDDWSRLLLMKLKEQHIDTEREWDKLNQPIASCSVWWCLIREWDFRHFWLLYLSFILFVFLFVCACLFLFNQIAAEISSNTTRCSSPTLHKDD